MSNTTVGREPVQIVKLTLPKCANTIGTAPCTSTATGDAKCFNTRATCKDIVNYRSLPEGGMGNADLTLRTEETIASGAITRTADLFAAFDVKFPPEPTGTIWEQGGSADQAAYLGVTGTNLVFRAGDGTSGTPTTTGVRITTPLTNVAGQTLTIFVEIDVSANSITLWKFCPCNLDLTQLATGTASTGFATWAGADGGAIGIEGGSNIATGEDGGTFNGVIEEARFYDSTPAPDMTNDFKLELYFGRKQVAKPSDNITIYPMITGMNTVGSKIQIANSDDSFDPLGRRAFVNIDMEDAPGSDLEMDPYLSDRTYDPLTLSTFWLKFRIRQKFGKLNAPVMVYEGYEGEALSAMDSRQYILDHINIQDRNRVQLHCRDILSQAELAKAQAPEASTGFLAADIDASVTSIEIDGADSSAYEAAGTVRINDEVITYTGITENTVAGTFTLTGCARGTDNTTADAHEINDSVQRCLRFTSQRVDDIIRTLLAEYANISYQFMDLANWKSEVDSYLVSYSLTRLITEPISVKELIGELSTQASFYIWWDELEQKIKMRSIRGQETEPTTLTDNENFLADSVSIRELPDQRLTQTWVYYSLRNPVEDLQDPANYFNLYVDANLELENAKAYGQRQIRKIFGTWLPTGAQAAATASRLSLRYEDVPVEITLEMDEKDASINLGEVYYLNHRMLVDSNGNKDTKRLFVIISREIMHLNGTVKYVAQDATLSGFIYVILSNATGDYVGDGTDQFNGVWISDTNGLMPNGDKGAVIS